MNSEYCKYLAFGGFFISLIGAFLNDGLWVVGIIIIIFATIGLFIENKHDTSQEEGGK